MTPPWICARCRHVAVDHAVVRQPLNPYHGRIPEPCKHDDCDCPDFARDSDLEAEPDAA